MSNLRCLNDVLLEMAKLYLDGSLYYKWLKLP